jgi:4-azaleucine resistance transporter AzlC
MCIGMSNKGGSVIVESSLPRAVPAHAAEIRRGALAMVPLWAGVLPFALAFGILARGAGFSATETQALSAFVFAGSAQIAIVNLFAGGAGAGAIVATAIVLNLRHILYGLSLGRAWSRPTRPPLPLLAFFLTDEAYGMTIKDRLDGRGGASFYWGASGSLYLIFNIGTLAGSLAGQFLPDPRRLGLDFVFPLVFVALLVPLLRGWRQCAVAAVAALATLLLGRVVAGGVAIVGAAVAAAALGVMLDRVGPRRTGGA